MGIEAKSSSDPPHDDQAVTRVARKFLADIPIETFKAGRWPTPRDVELLTQSHPVGDGTYRVDSADWVFRFAGGRLVEAFRIGPPDYGGPDVRQLWADDAVAIAKDLRNP